MKADIRPAFAAALLAYAGAAAALWPYDRPPSISASELLEKVRARYRDLGDFQAELSVVTTSALMGDAAAQSGTIFARQPDLFRVEFREPYVQTIVFDGAHMYVVTAGSNQVVRYDDAGFAELVNLPQALDRLEEDYDVALAAETAGRTYEMHLAARGPEALFPKIYLWISRDQFVITRADLFDGSGGSTSYRFSSYRFDVGLPAGRFAFQVPPGAEVVEMGGAGP